MDLNFRIKKDHITGQKNLKPSIIILDPHGNISQVEIQLKNGKKVFRRLDDIDLEVLEPRKNECEMTNCIYCSDCLRTIPLIKSD